MSELANVFSQAIDKVWIKRGPRDQRGSRYICFAIDDVKASHSVKEQAKAIVLSRISPYNCVESWLEKQGLISVNQLCDLFHYQCRDEKIEEKIQLYRRAWLKSLAEEFSSTNITPRTIDLL